MVPLRVVSFVGTRPEIIKTLAFCRAAPHVANLEFLVAHTGQNHGADMADGFLRDLDIRVVSQNPSLDRTSMGSAAKGQIDFIASCLAHLAPDVVISNTDTDTAFYSALVGARIGVPVARIEGGIRCEARHNPEEINRRLADHLGEWVFTISEEDSRALHREGFPPSSIFMLGDITLDALRIVLREHSIPVMRGDYDVLTIHRQENANSAERLKRILEGVERAGFPTVFPIHPRTRGALDRAGLLESVERSKSIQVRSPLGYFDMLRLAAGCRKVISDSGGLRREGYMLDKPVISLVNFVWFHQMNALGFELSVDADSQRISQAITGFDPPGPRPELFGDGHAGQRILEKLRDLGERSV